MNGMLRNKSELLPLCCNHMHILIHGGYNANSKKTNEKKKEEEKNEGKENTAAYLTGEREKSSRARAHAGGITM